MRVATPIMSKVQGNKAKNVMDIRHYRQFFNMSKKISKRVDFYDLRV